MGTTEMVSSRKLDSDAPRRKLLPWTVEQSSRFCAEPVVAKHRLNELDMFRDLELVDLLDRYPRDRLQAFTMGDDPLRWGDWQPVDIAGVGGAELFEAVSRGRLWLNILQVHQVDRRFASLMDELFAELVDQCVGFRPVRKFGTLLISSPKALVYYHADAQPNLLWHIRGSKRVWVYPARDPALIPQQLMEDIFANFADEEVPYKQEFDEKAIVYDLVPGDVLSWPQNAPHRIRNLEGVNVSLSTPYETAESDRRKLVYCANRLIRHTFRIPVRSTKETGVVSYVKRLAFRAWRRAGMVRTPPRRAYVATLRVDARAANGVRALTDGPILTEFSK